MTLMTTQTGYPPQVIRGTTLVSSTTVAQPASGNSKPFGKGRNVYQGVAR